MRCTGHIMLLKYSISSFMSFAFHEFNTQLCFSLQLSSCQLSSNNEASYFGWEFKFSVHLMTFSLCRLSNYVPGVGDALLGVFPFPATLTGSHLLQRPKYLLSSSSQSSVLFSG